MSKSLDSKLLLLLKSLDLKRIVVVNKVIGLKELIVQPLGLGSCANSYICEIQGGAPGQRIVFEVESYQL